MGGRGFDSKPRAKCAARSRSCVADNVLLVLLQKIRMLEDNREIAKLCCRQCSLGSLAKNSHVGRQTPNKNPARRGVGRGLCPVTAAASGPCVLGSYSTT